MRKGTARRREVTKLCWRWAPVWFLGKESRLFREPHSINDFQHWTSGFAGTTLLTFCLCQQHSKVLQEMALRAIIITGKYLASQHLSGTACDCCFTYKPLIFSVLYCISSHLETAPRGAIVSIAAGFPVLSAACLQTGSSHLARLTDAVGALSSSEVTLAPSFSCILSRTG